MKSKLVTLACLWALMAGVYGEGFNPMTYMDDYRAFIEAHSEDPCSVCDEVVMERSKICKPKSLYKKNYVDSHAVHEIAQMCDRQHFLEVTEEDFEYGYQYRIADGYAMNGSNLLASTATGLVQSANAVYGLAGMECGIFTNSDDISHLFDRLKIHGYYYHTEELIEGTEEGDICNRDYDKVALTDIFLERIECKVRRLETRSLRGDGDTHCVDYNIIKEAEEVFKLTRKPYFQHILGRTIALEYAASSSELGAYYDTSEQYTERLVWLLSLRARLLELMGAPGEAQAALDWASNLYATDRDVLHEINYGADRW